MFMKEPYFKSVLQGYVQENAPFTQNLSQLERMSTKVPPTHALILQSPH